MELSVIVAANGDLLRHGDNLLRASSHTQFTTLAVILVYNYAGHLFIPVKDQLYFI